MGRGPRLPQYQKHSPIVKLPFLQQEEHHGATKVPTQRQSIMQQFLLPPRISVVPERTLYGRRPDMTKSIQLI